MAEQYVHVDRSQSFRLSELEAAWLRLSLPDLAAGNERRRHIAARYRAAGGAALAGRPPRPRAPPGGVRYRPIAREPERALAAKGVATAVHYPLALTQQPAYRDLARAPCPASEAWAAACVSVPCFPELTDDEVEHVVAALAELAERRRAMADPVVPQPGRRRRVRLLPLLQRRRHHRQDGHRRATASSGDHVDDFELIVVNDGSQDGSAEVLEALAAARPVPHGGDPRAQPRLRRGAHQRVRGGQQGVDLLHRRRRPVRRRRSRPSCIRAATPHTDVVQGWKIGGATRGTAR